MSTAMISVSNICKMHPFREMYDKWTNHRIATHQKMFEEEHKTKLSEMIEKKLKSIFIVPCDYVVLFIKDEIEIG